MADGAPRAGGADPWEARVDALLCEVLELPPAERRDHLRAACGGDRRLFAEVESLLVAGEATDPLLRPAGAVTPDLLEMVAGAAAVPGGTQIGRYRVVREIGRGGMGTVYLAERADGQFDQRVALKVLPAGAEPAALERFTRERQILADLEHPRIARLIDGGVTFDARPYLVMEYVDGVALDRYCRDRDLGPRRRIELLSEVCAAVQAAHRQLVVHRDLKPSNILVTAEGRIKLLDFGIAKLLDGERPAATMTAGRFLTPQYASPEQFRGEPITVASDVYQLGLIAYELFYDRRPYDLGAASAAEAERLICRQEPPRPGGGDLETVVLKALHKDPDRRYGSAERLREDLERTLQGLPVSARPDTWSYRWGKFARRHALAVSAAAVVAVAVPALAGAFTWSLARERDQTRLAAERAEQRRLETEQVVDYLTGLFEASDPYGESGPAGELSARDLLDRGAARLDAGLPRGSPVRARLLHAVGRIYGRMELGEEALPLLEEALALTRSGPGDHRLDEAAVLVDLGRVLMESPRLDEAEAAFRGALALRREVLGAGHAEVAGAAVHLANLLHRIGRYDEREALLRQALAVFDALEEPDPLAHSLALLQLGQVELERGETAAALVHFERALALGRDRFGPDHPAVAAALKTLARAHAARGDPEAGQPLLEEALRIYEERFGAGSLQVSNVRQNLAVVAHARGDVEESRRLFAEALVTVEAIKGAGSFDAVALRHNLAELRLEQGDAAGAERELRALRAIQERTLDPAHKLHALTLHVLGQSLAAQGRHREALAPVRECLERVEANFGPDGQYADLCLLDLARIHRRLGQPELAEPCFRRALEIRRATMTPGAAELREAAAEYAAFLREQGREEEAAAAVLALS